MEVKKIDFTSAIDKRALHEAMKNKEKRKELERIFSNFKNNIR